MKIVLGGIAVVAAFGLNIAQAAAPSCDHDRTCLAGVMDGYLKALLRHDPAALATTRNIKYTENGVRITMGDGLWQTAVAMPTYRLDVIDEEAGSVGLIGRISENGNNNWYGVRLKVEPDRKVSQIEVLIGRSAGGAPAPAPAPRAGGAPAAAPAPAPAAKPGNTEPHPLMAQVIPENKRMSRAELASIGNSYFTGLDTKESSEGIPFDPACQRRENGSVTANNPDATPNTMASWDCKKQFDTGFSVIVTDIRERRFEVVDRTKGLAFGWGYFDHNGTVATFTNTPDPKKINNVSGSFRQPITFYIAEVFKVMDGKIRQIEAVLTTVPYAMESGW
jgi:hypothetical protein